MRTPSIRKRAEFYDQLGVYLDAGTPIQDALGSLAQSGDGAIRSICLQAQNGIMSGLTFGNALSLVRPTIPRFEQAMLHAAELTGRLPQISRTLGNDLQRILELRRSAIMASLYPAFILHAAILIAPLLQYVVRGVVQGEIDWPGYWKTVLMALIGLHGWIWGTWMLIRLLRRNVGSGVAIESFLRCIPVVGKTWWSMVVAKFTRAYDGLLNAGVNVFDALDIASQACGSATLRKKIESILPHVRAGEPVGQWLLATHALGKPWEEFWVTGEQSGRQEEMLGRIVQQSTEAAEHGFAFLKGAIPKIIYIGALLFVAYQIVSAFASYAKVLNDVMSDKY